jgi:RNA polymerase sigma factor (sigma-70 family)
MKRLNADPEFQKRNKAQASERMKRLNADPEFQKRQSERMKRLWKNPEWRENQTELITIAIRKYWSLIRSGLLAEFKSRGLIAAIESRSEKGHKQIAGITETPLKELVRTEQQTLTQQAIERLPIEEKEAIIATFIEGANRLEVAEQMGVDVNKLDQILNRAYKQLARELRGLQ